MRGFAVLALLALSGLAPTAAQAEHLASQAVPGFVVGYEAGNSEQSIREEVQDGETVQDWTRMVTTQRFGGAATRLTPTAFIDVVTRNLLQGCPGATTGRVVTSSIGGRPAARFRADCPRVSQTGKPETFILLAITGEQDLLVKQVAFRRVPTAADIRWGEEILGAVAFCATGNDAGACGT
jgi:hypothetical protein